MALGGSQIEYRHGISRQNKVFKAMNRPLSMLEGAP